jgi:hypothetical protein
MSERKRAHGFALMDTAFAADPKFVRLQRKAKSPSDYAAAVGVFWMVLADCRRAKSPEVVWADYEEYATELDLLKEARLLLPNGFAQPAFDRWAPAYKSPWDVRRGTQGNAEVHKDTQQDATSALLASTHISSTNEEGGVGETQLDAFEFACRILTYVPNSDDWRIEMTELEEKHGTEQTVIALQVAYRTAVDAGRRLSPFDLLKETRTLLKLDKHREDKELSNEERVKRAEALRAREAKMLADIQRQHDEEFRKRHPELGA